MIVTVVPHAWKRGHSYRVRIRQGVQSFTLEYDGTKSDCEFMAKMFRKALKAHDKQKQTRG